MNEVITKLINLPTTIRAYTIRTPDDDFVICVNARLSHDERINACQHELKHIKADDYYKKGSIDRIEIYAHMF